MCNEQCAYSKNGGLRKYANRFKKSTIFYFIKLGIAGNVLNEDTDLVVIPEKAEHVDCNTKTENPLKCAHKNLHLSEILEENGGKLKLMKYKGTYLMTISNYLPTFGHPQPKYQIQT